MDKFSCMCAERNLKQIAYELFSRLNPYKKPVFMCVGSDKVIADSLAPMIAEMLKKKYNISAYIYGGLDYNINASNLVTCYNYITTIHSDCEVILIDASLGDRVGEVSIGSGAYAGANNVVPIKKMGDISILGVVGKKSNDFRLGYVKLKEIVDMAEVIAKAIAMAMSVK